MYFWPCIGINSIKLPLVNVHDLTHYYYVFLALYWYNSIKLPLVSVPKIHNNNVLDHEHLLKVVLYCYTNTQPKIHNNNVLDHEHLLEVVLYCYCIGITV
jgi:hypothetical protein